MAFTHCIEEFNCKEWCNIASFVDCAAPEQKDKENIEGCGFQEFIQTAILYQTEM